jgi:uncharacterized protein (DUF305 family)
MKPLPYRRLAVAVLVIGLVAAACSSATRSAPPAAPAPPAPAPVVVSSDAAAIARAKADSAVLPWTAADAHFMAGMIAHHAQAILMAGWAADRAASPSVRTLAERIITAQQDEIVILQQWLSDRLQPVPEPDPAGMKMSMGGAEHTMLMPGMLTPDQLKQLEQVRGREFDRLFLTFMIQHHRGAVSMVNELFSARGAGQNQLVFKVASDINVDQTTEIARMEKMLAAMTSEPRIP